MTWPGTVCVLVTGGPQNTGRAVAQRLARDGYVVAVGGRKDMAVQEVVDSIEASDGRALPVVITGTFTCMRVVLSGMRDRQSRRLIAFSGISAQGGAAGRVAIVAAKAAAIDLMKLSHWTRRTAASPSTLSPRGVIDTVRPDSAPRYFYDRGAAATPVGRMGNTEKVADLCYLSSESAGFITGHVMAINGGLYI